MSLHATMMLFLIKIVILKILLLFLRIMKNII